ncbi:unnamed protein product, partial [Larinioides sclopetarius]
IFCLFIKNLSLLDKTAFYTRNHKGDFFFVFNQSINFSVCISNLGPPHLHVYKIIILFRAMALPNVAAGSDRTLFLGPRIPNYVKSFAKNLNNIKKPVFRQMVKLALLDFEGKDVNPEMYLAIKKAAQDSCNVDVVYGALYTLLKCALSLPEASLKQDRDNEEDWNGSIKTSLGYWLLQICWSRHPDDSELKRSGTVPLRLLLAIGYFGYARVGTPKIQN